MRFAACAHAGQARKGSNIPYLSHPATVAIILERAGFDDDVLAGALLHDVVEDTNRTIDEIAREFPEAVVEYVRALTEKKKDDSGAKRPWEDRKRDHIEQLRGCSLGARAIELADKLHNLESILDDLDHDGSVVWSRFNSSPERIAWYYRSMLEACDQGEPELQALVNACRNAIDRLEVKALKTP